MAQSKKVIILTSDASWVEPLRALLDAEYGAVTVIAFPSTLEAVLQATQSAAVVVNLLAALPETNIRESLDRSMEVLEALERLHVRVVNDATCHRHALSKRRQQQAFQAAGLETPQTFIWRTGEPEPSLDGKAAWLVKPNVGGRGAGISTNLSDLESAAGHDGVALIQERIIPNDGRIHRVELLNGELLYHAAALVEEGKYDYCLGGAAPSQINRRLPDGLESRLQRLAAHTHMQLGSVEFLIDDEGVARFVDFNPTSTLAPQACAAIGFDPLRCQAIWICHQIIPEMIVAATA